MNGTLPTYTLRREQSSSTGTPGEILKSDGSHLCCTCELPWLNNLADKSCIPSGTYTCIPHNSADHPNTWELQNVAGRGSILIHNGNAAGKDSKGCILVGDSLGTIAGLPAVLNSVKTLDMLRHTLPQTFVLTILGPS